MTSKRTLRYAAYGSNLHPLRLTKRIKSAQLIATAFLPRWSLRFHKRGADGSGKCSIHVGGDGVHFAIYEVSAADKARLDKIEGVGFGYSLTSLVIPDIGECFSYVAADSHIDDSLQPYDWYKQLVALGAQFHDFPDDYLMRIESVRATRDHKATRRSRNWHVVDLVKSALQ